MSGAEILQVSRANALTMAGCMEEAGREFPRAYQNWDAVPALPDRRYGIWSSEDAERNGYELPETPESEALLTVEDAFDDAWWQTLDRCRSESEMLPLLGVNTDPGRPSPVDQGMNDSFTSLLAGDKFREIKAAWLACIESEGLSPRPDANVLVPQFPEAGEDQIRVASIDVSCKDELNSVQTLADEETQWQLAYIDQHEGELKAYRDRVDEVLEQARAIVSSGNVG